MYKLGIDASSYDSGAATDWRACHFRGIDWASLRLVTTDRNHKAYVDPSFMTNYTRCLENSMKVYAYAWLDPLGNLTDQCKTFSQNVPTGVNWVGLDCEDSGLIHANSKTGAMIVDWQDWIKDEHPQPIIDYMPPSYMFNYLSGYPALAGDNLMVANYMVGAPTVYPPFTPDWVAWQYTKKASGRYYGFDMPGFSVKEVALAVMREDFYNL
jgi:GH25 family lysozyme M1 (1,4-beta-N-acetylmuramidase)